MRSSYILIVAYMLAGLIAGTLIGFNLKVKLSDHDSDSFEPHPRRGDHQLLGSRFHHSGRSATSSEGRSIEKIRCLPGSVSRVQALVTYYNTLDLEQFSDEADKLSRLPHRECRIAKNLLFARWGELDIISALNYNEAVGVADDYARSYMIWGWASADPQAAARFYEENPDRFIGGSIDNDSRQTVRIIVEEWSKLDATAAREWAARFNP